MDPSAPKKVLKNVAITSSLCGAAAGLYGGFKHGAPSKFLLYSAVNSGIVAATFFSIREYVVSPAMVLTLPGRQYQLRRQRLLGSVGRSTSEEPTTLSWSDVRTSYLLDSGISGGLAGGLLNAWKRGKSGLAPGFTTGALMCTLLQWCFNEFNIFRIRYISSNSAVSSGCITHGPTNAGQSSSAELSPSAALQSEVRSLNSPTEHILSMFGQRISDEKYLERLRMERDSHLRRIAELEEMRKQ